MTVPVYFKEINGFLDSNVPSSALGITSRSRAKLIKHFKHTIFIDKILSFKYLDSLSDNSLHKSIDYVVGIGGGRAMDCAKYIGTRLNKNIILIPTIISTDAPFTSSTGVRKNGCVYYTKTNPPKEILLDLDLIASADARYNIAGAGDILSIHTALHDWRLANNYCKISYKEKWDDNVASQAKQILFTLKNNAPIIATNTKEGVSTLTDLLIKEVKLCDSYGCSRPEEGSEHFLAYALENELNQPVLHGELIALSTLIMSAIQGQDASYIRKSVDELNIGRPKISPKTVIDTLISLPDYVSKHNLCFSQANLIKAEDISRIKEAVYNVLSS